MNLYQNNDPDRQGHHLSILRSHYQFLLEDSHDSKGEGWEMRMVRAYHARLFKEYCLADLSIPGKIGLRWRTEAEVEEGRGHLSCGNLSCTRRDGLDSWEVHFRYREGGEIKEALVKVRLCPECSTKLPSTTRRARRDQQLFP